jgi:hypothetical protein
MRSSRGRQRAVLRFERPDVGGRRRSAPDGITVAVRIGFPDNRSLGPKETGARVALPVFEELMLRVYRATIAGPVPSFPPQMEQHITDYLEGDAPALVAGIAPIAVATGAP